MMHVIGFTVLSAVGAHMVYSAWIEWMGSLAFAGGGFDFIRASSGIGLVALAIRVV